MESIPGDMKLIHCQTSMLSVVGQWLFDWLNECI
jgi:hypothetical protein